MDSVPLLQGDYLCFQKRTTKAPINPPALGNCPLFCLTGGGWSRLVPGRLSLLGCRAPQGVPGKGRDAPCGQSCWDRGFLWGVTSPCSELLGLPSWEAAAETPSSELHPSLPKSFPDKIPHSCLHATGATGNPQPSAHPLAGRTLQEAEKNAMRRSVPGQTLPFPWTNPSLSMAKP